jgi:hypothetical protein
MSNNQETKVENKKPEPVLEESICKTCEEKFVPRKSQKNANTLTQHCEECIRKHKNDMAQRRRRSVTEFPEGFQRRRQSVTEIPEAFQRRRQSVTEFPEAFQRRRQSVTEIPNDNGQSGVLIESLLSQINLSKQLVESQKQMIDRLMFDLRNANAEISRLRNSGAN